MDFLQHPDTTVKPTESKEELMANARLMQQTLAQFDIEVSLGDITKGPTITRYELHPAPGVKLEKISALGNNIAAALKAERINILAPVARQKFRRRRGAKRRSRPRSSCRDLLESEEWVNYQGGAFPARAGQGMFMAIAIIADLAEMPHLLNRRDALPVPANSVCINSIIASLL